MENILITLLNLSITASYIIIAVILLRYVLFKAPKWINCLLWSVVGLRLAFPFSIESVLSLIPSAKPIPDDIAMSRDPQIDTGLDLVNSAVNPIISRSFKPEPVQSANPLQIWLPIASIIWIAGLCAILLWGIISYALVRKKTVPSINIRDNIYICDNISSPFILGIIRPKIYLPSSVSGEQASVVIEHEKAHISRLDHIWKPVGFVLLSVYWFNPLVWLAYILLCRDIEKACDQKVIKKMSDDSRRIYSQTLLSYSANSVRISACPLAFGEVAVKTRVRSILNYKKPAFWIIVVAIVLLIATAVVFLTYPKAEKPENKSETDVNPSITPIYGETDPSRLTDEQRELIEEFPEYFGLNCANGLNVYVWQLSPNGYYFGLMENIDADLSDTPIGHHQALRGVHSSEMRAILASYDIPVEKINIIPCQKIYSSYIGDYWMMKVDDEEYNRQVREAYMLNVKLKLFDEQYDKFTTACDTTISDIDDDGRVELCAIGKYPVSGETFIYLIYEPYSGQYEYKAFED